MIAPPADIEQAVIATEAAPVGTVDRVAASAVVRSVDTDGVMVVDSDHGPLTVLIAKPVDGRYRPGVPIRVETAVQAMKLVPAGSAPSTSSNVGLAAAPPRACGGTCYRGATGSPAFRCDCLSPPRSARVPTVPDAQPGGTTVLCCLRPRPLAAMPALRLQQWSQRALLWGMWSRYGGYCARANRGPDWPAAGLHARVPGGQDPDRPAASDPGAQVGDDPGGQHRGVMGTA